MNKALVKEIKEQLQGDDSILVDPSAAFVEGAEVFFGKLVEVLPGLKDTFLILPEGIINKVNEKLQSQDPKVQEEGVKAADWIQKAVDMSENDDYKVIIVGEAVGAYEGQTILDQVSFLLPNHNVLLITQDQNMTLKARALRNPATQKGHKLHCCLVKPEGRLGLYYFPSDSK